MKITGTIINYYFHCKTQMWLHSNRLNLEDNSEDVRIGRVLHEINEESSKNAEVKIENIAIDKITDNYVVELKKSDSDMVATKWQLLYYLYILKQKGIVKSGRLEYFETNKQDKKSEIVTLDEVSENELLIILQEIEKLMNSNISPTPEFLPKCKKCAYYEYCFI